MFCPQIGFAASIRFAGFLYLYRKDSPFRSYFMHEMNVARVRYTVLNLTKWGVSHEQGEKDSHGRHSLFEVRLCGGHRGYREGDRVLWNLRFAKLPTKPEPAQQEEETGNDCFRISVQTRSNANKGLVTNFIVRASCLL